jgi:riboflavin transporter FmnP
LPAIIPFNLIKAGLNSAITMVVYKSVGKVLITQSREPIKKCA